MRIYAFNSESHAVFRDQWFLPTLSSLHDKFELIVSSDSSQKDSAYGTREFNRFMEAKVDLLVDAIRDNWGTVFIYSDIDVQFFQPFEKNVPQLIGENHLVVQRDSPQGHLCAGFMILKADWEVLNLFQEIKRQLSLNCDVDDQAVLNVELVKNAVPEESRQARYDELVNEAFWKARADFAALPKITNQFGVKWNYLPETFFGGGTFSGKAWNPGDEIAIPDDAVVHHANWTNSLQCKIAQLKYVREKHWQKVAVRG